MIENERQYRVTQALASRFAQTLDALKRRSNDGKRVHPRIKKAQVEAVSSQLADLERDLRSYESSEGPRSP